MIRALQKLRRDSRGSMAIETAFIVPVLATLCVGGFEASQMVARNAEMQTAAAEATSIVLASPPETQAERDVIEDVIEASTGLPDASVTLSVAYRCGVEENYVSADTICFGTDATDDDNQDEGGYTTEEVSTFIVIQMQDAYAPTWTQFGVGDTVHYDITRRVQIS